MHCMLDKLPLELLEFICDELETHDLASLLGTCRQTYHRTIHRLAQRYSEVHLDFSKGSLNQIHAIANNEVMRQQVQRLVVMAPEPFLGRNLDWQRSAAGHILNPLEVPTIRQFRNDLVDKLVNCRSFIISPLGSHLAPEEDNTDAPDDRHFSPDDAASILLDIIADSALPVKLFWYGRGTNYNSDIMNIQRLPKALFTSPRFRSGWGSLTNLHLEHKLTPNNYSFLLNMLLNTPNLRKLYLSLAPKDLAIEFYSHVAKSDALSCVLERISLCYTAIRPSDLMHILSWSRQSLKRLVLTQVGGISADLPQLHDHLISYPCLENLDFRMCQ
ncbi:uncharacterized protein BO97DRAFT_143751 [Aspergillus homomorphus CBS 101889]|uniref:F-box domain-containing protein n=1 Tax=Aspergillus homomorphus (strain CBS 101889) TaxID=1450537 RepID=A0A395HQS4_ASPHC|nr:hypothetical protein BO97DRAFT_143751 [Aspergillus homomorphus CBS 101889]RAL10167.1 hypothetical protein BO97DRAFT_143751 [Aspergillus homomorphus CBS 101889]